MNRLKKTLTITALVAAMSTATAQEKIILLNEGDWQCDNGRVTYFEDGEVVSNQWFRDMNGVKIGDTPNDIIQVNDSLIAITVNWSNIVQFITPQGKAVAATEDIPNNRCLATDGSYVYVTSYGHECATVSGTQYFAKGFVAKIDLTDFTVVSATEVGWEPDGIAYYDGHLFVANSGGYAGQEEHDYEHTVSVLDASTMETVRTVDVKQINLYGTMSQSGRYLCINSPGDYYSVAPATVIFDCAAALSGKPDRECFSRLDIASTYNCRSMDGDFYAVGSHFSYTTGLTEFNYVTIHPELVMQSGGSGGVTASLPGNITEDVKKMTAPYSIYVNPYTGYIYATDAGSYASAGYMYQWNPEGELLGTHRVYINPAHFLALNPEGESGCGLTVEEENGESLPMFNLQGIMIQLPRKGEPYIRGGRKYIMN